MALKQYVAPGAMLFKEAFDTNGRSFILSKSSQAWKVEGRL